MFHRIIFLLLILSSLSRNFNRCAVCFQSFMNIACRSTQNAARIKRFLRLHIVIKPLNTKKHSKFLLCWSVTLSMFSANLALVESENRLAVQVILEIFWTVSLKDHDWSSWILTECNLSWKSMKYRILSEVCMINSTVSPQMWCIKSIKGWFTQPQICWQARFCKVNLSKAKNSAWFFSRPNLLRSRAILALECDRRWLLFFGCPYKAINSM